MGSNENNPCEEIDRVPQNRLTPNKSQARGRLIKNGPSLRPTFYNGGCKEFVDHSIMNSSPIGNNSKDSLVEKHGNQGVIVLRA